MNKKILVTVKNIVKKFDDGVRVIEALKGVSLSIMEGEIVSLLGVNGAGKTTLSTIIAMVVSLSLGCINHLVNCCDRLWGFIYFYTQRVNA